MEKQGLFLRLNEVIDDPNLDMPVVNSFAFLSRREGNGSGTTAFPYTTTGDVNVRILGGELFRDENATQLLGTSTVINGIGTVWIKVIKETAKIMCRNGDRIIGLGNASSYLSKPQTGNAVNSPYNIFTIDTFPVNLIYLEGSFGRNIYNGNFRTFMDRCTKLVSVGLGAEYIDNDRYSSNLYGDMTDSTALHRIELFTTNGLRIVEPSRLIFSTASIGAYYNVLNTGTIYGDIKDFRSVIGSLETQPDVIIVGLYGDLKLTPPSLQYLSFPQYVLNHNIIYSGGKIWRNDFASLLLDAIPLNSSSIDLLLNEMSSLAWSSPKILRLRGTRTSASDSAIAALQSKGVTVTINA